MQLGYPWLSAVTVPAQRINLGLIFKFSFDIFLKFIAYYTVRSVDIVTRIWSGIFHLDTFVFENVDNASRINNFRPKDSASTTLQLGVCKAIADSAYAEASRPE